MDKLLDKHIYNLLYSYLYVIKTFKNRKDWRNQNKKLDKQNCEKMKKVQRI